MGKTKKTSTFYGVFIIESLREGDFKDGLNLKEILKLSLIEYLYRDVANTNEFISALDEFKKSGYRYLHMSCHASIEGIEIGSTFISNLELMKIFDGNLRNRRVFFSACEASNLNTATIVIDKCDGQSVIGPNKKIDEDKAALFWPSFYHVINGIDSQSMNQESISTALQECVNLFKVPINYYFKSKRKGRLKRYKVRPGRKINKMRIRIALGFYI